MMRQAYINWEKFSETSNVQAGKKYMIAEIVSEFRDKVVDLTFGTYYTAGMTVDLDLKQTDEDMENKTKEERLLQALFGSTKKYTIPKDGFYIKTSNYGVDEEIEDGAFAGCTEECIYIGGYDIPVFFAEMPLAPEGYDTVEEDRQKTHERICRRFEMKKQEELDTNVAIMDADDVIKATVISLTGKSDLDFNEKIHLELTGSVCYDVSTAKIIQKCVMAKRIAETYNNVCKMNMIEEIRSKTIKLCEEMDMSKSVEYISELQKKFNCSDKELQYVLNSIIYCDFSFYDIRRRYIKKYKRDKNHIVDIMTKAYADFYIYKHIGRFSELLEISAPEIILENELKKLTENIIMKECKWSDEYEIEPETFAKVFDVYPNAEPYEMTNDANEDEKTGFSIHHAPASIMFEYDYALYNNETNEYYKEDGKIKGFTDKKAALSFKNELEKN